MPEHVHHKEFLKALSEHEKQRLQRRSDQRGLLHLAGYLVTLLFVSYLIITGFPFWPLLVIPQGLLLVFTFTLEHECTHKTPFRTEKLNEWVGQICGGIGILPFEYFRYFHLAHHRHTNDPDRDPELLAGHKPETQMAFYWHLSGIMVWVGNIKILLRNAFGTITDSFVPQGAHGRLRREARILVGIYTVILLLSIFATSLFIWLWILPMLLAQPFLRVYLLAEHGRCPSVANMFENTRTTFTSRAIKFLSWNMPYHAEHHIFPNVPFYLLPDLHKFTAEYLVVTENGYQTFFQDYHNAIIQKDDLH